MTNKIHISLASDARNVAAMATAIVSSLHNKNADDFYVFYLLLAGEVGIDLQKKLHDCAVGFEESCEINFIDLKDKFSNIDLGCYITYAAYFRIMLSSILPNLEKIIYIDTDTLVRQNLTELWNFDIGENYIAGVPSFSWQYHRAKYKRANFLTTDFCINSGVMLMNLKEWRANGIEQKCLDKIGDKKLGKIEKGDQVILNFVCYPKIGFLPCKWNMSYDKIQNYNGYLRKYDLFFSAGELNDAWNNPAIFHWTGPRKPWMYYNVPLAHEWFRYYIKTPFAHNRHLQRTSCIKSKFSELIRIAMSIIKSGNL
ncbi:glycosyl transferase [Fibrobacteria bacterium R8-3-H12]